MIGEGAGARMPPIAQIAIGAVAGYLAGSVSFSQIVGERAAPGQDLSVTTIEVRETGTTVEFRGTPRPA